MSGEEINAIAALTRQLEIKNKLEFIKIRTKGPFTIIPFPKEQMNAEVLFIKNLAEELFADSYEAAEKFANEGFGRVIKKDKGSK